MIANRDKIIVVDDEESVLTAIQRLLRKEELDVVVTSLPASVIEELSRNQYSVIISDQRMPGMKGSELLERIKESSPDTVRILLTGYAGIEEAKDAVNRGAIYRFLTKPWEEEEIKTAIRQAIEHYHLILEKKRLQDLVLRQNEQLKLLNGNLEKKVEERTHQILVLNKELKGSLLATTKVLANLSEMYSMDIGSHSVRVSRYSVAIANELKLAERDIFEIEVASTLHDIGKIGLPESIHDKQEDEMDDAELDKYKLHPLRGEAILSLIGGLGNAPRYVRHHHEDFDGGGFPDGYRGKFIPIGSRIITLADAFDKFLTAPHSYDGRASLKKLVGKYPGKFDPEVVSAFNILLSKNSLVISSLYEIELKVRELKEGMVLARDIVTAKGVLLLRKDSRIEKSLIQRILNYQDKDPIIDLIAVRRNSIV